MRRAVHRINSLRAACTRNAERVSLRRLAAASMALSIPRSSEMFAETTRVPVALKGTEIKTAPAASSAAMSRSARSASMPRAWRHYRILRPQA